MTPETFCEQFATFAEAPHGVAKLRELILQLAVQGKLGTQDGNDEPASVLLERAREASSENRSGTKPKGKQPAAKTCLPDDLPECPNGWVWSTLDEMGVVSPRNDLLDDADVSFLPMASISTKYNGPLEPETRKWRDVKQGFTHVADGDVAMAKITPCFQNGKTTVMRGLTNGYGAGTTELHVLRPYPNCLMPEYAVIFLRSPLFVAQGIETMSGTAGQQRVRKEHFAESPFPLPPLAEQRRIVGKVDQLLGLCDELAARQAARREARSALVGATLDRLVSARSAAEFPAHAHRLRDHFDRLFDTPTTIPQLRQAILQLAVQGQLVPQDPNDEPVGVYHCDANVRAGEAPADPDDIKDLHFTVPRCWRWHSVSDVFDVSGGITKNPKRTPVKNHYPYLRVANVQRGRLKLDEIERFELCDGELERWRLEPGDVLVVEGNGSADEIGRCALWNGEIANCVHQNHIIRCRPLIHDLQNFVLLFLNSPAGIAEMKERAITTSGLYSLSVGKIRSLVIPLPPLSEQKRIVSKVTELLSLCDALEAKLTQAESASTQLNTFDGGGNVSAALRR